MHTDTPHSHITFRQASPADAPFISRGFHAAMLYDDASEEQISLFARHICTRTDVLYSWRNTVIAEAEGRAAGMITSYDGSRYREMRLATMPLVRQHLGIEFPGMEDEALPGEYYLDSLAVCSDFRGKGIGTALLRHAMEAGTDMGLKVTLAVDPVNHRARRLYESLGFRYDSDLFIFGHTYHKLALMECSI